MPQSLAPADLVNLDRYPIDGLATARGKALVELCRADMASEGGVNLQGFLRPWAIEALCAEALSLLPQAYLKVARRNVYGTPIDPSWPEDHPGRRMLMAEGTNSQIAYDQIPGTAGIRRLYLWDRLMAFIAAVLDRPRIHPFADPFQALNLIYEYKGAGTPWHFDGSAFNVTLLLKEPLAGGIFEYMPFIKSDDEPNLSGIRRVLDGDQSGVRAPERRASTLTIFSGEHSLHRVTPVAGDETRISAVLTYDERPDRVDSDQSNIRIYGPRVAAIIARRERADHDHAGA
ncbi:MAG: hypothetical protein WD673_14725 [Alphaproteobacteria bacterium]